MFMTISKSATLTAGSEELLFEKAASYLTESYGKAGIDFNSSRIRSQIKLHLLYLAHFLGLLGTLKAVILYVDSFPSLKEQCG